MRIRRLAVPAAVVLIVGTLAGCAAWRPTMCSAVGWTNQVRVHVVGDTAQVDDVTFCAGTDCTPPPPPTPAPNTTYLTTRDGDEWTLITDMQTPNTGHLAAYDETGARLIDQQVALRWVRVGGSAECGGPERADVTLHLP
ncbi:hypothetical protein GCM10022286_14040 [Gryllotalpicola daejeonensis]|uniref:Lipoprotein n=1 Tax=Gryllotalpicola daejeonensis TaxID=993087 RepID=A0ABP7ZJ01_9MICO